MNTKSYKELIQLKTYEERLKYLSLEGRVGVDTFGYDRYLNQSFYKSKEWLSLRHEIIVRDGACDLGIADRDIFSHIIVHHINPVTVEDLQNRSPKMLDPNNLICTTKKTHDAIHYGNKNQTVTTSVERSKNDTIPWR